MMAVAAAIKLALRPVLHTTWRWWQPRSFSWDGSPVCHCSHLNRSCRPRSSCSTEYAGAPPSWVGLQSPKLQLWIPASPCSWGSREQAESAFPGAAAAAAPTAAHLGLPLQEAGRSGGQAGALPLPSCQGGSSRAQLWPTLPGTGPGRLCSLHPWATHEGHPIPACSGESEPHCLASLRSRHLFRSRSWVGAKPRGHEWQQEEDRLRGGKEGVPSYVPPSSEGGPEGWGPGCQSCRPEWGLVVPLPPTHGRPWTNWHVLPPV